MCNVLIVYRNIQSFYMDYIDIHYNIFYTFNMYFNLISHSFEHDIFHLSDTIYGVMFMIISGNNQYNINLSIIIISSILIQKSLKHKEKHTGENPIIFTLCHIIFLHRIRSIYLEIRNSGDISHLYNICFKNISKEESNLKKLDYYDVLLYEMWERLEQMFYYSAIYSILSCQIISTTLEYVC